MNNDSARLIKPYRSRKLIASFHNPKTKWDNFSGKQEINNVRVVTLDQSSNYTQTCQSQVLKRSSLACGIQERIQVKRNVSLKEGTSG